MNTWPSKLTSTIQGFSLLEVLIASTMFSLGMAGLSTLLLVNLGNSAQAHKSSIASSAAANLAEQIQLNPLATARYLSPPPTVSGTCLSAVQGTALCSPTQQADYDYNVWRQELAQQIQHATAVVCNDSSPEDGNRSNSQCDGSGSLVIKIFWGGPPVSSGQPVSEYRYTLVTGQS